MQKTKYWPLPIKSKLTQNEWYAISHIQEFSTLWVPYKIMGENHDSWARILRYPVNRRTFVLFMCDQFVLGNSQQRNW